VAAEAIRLIVAGLVRLSLFALGRVQRWAEPQLALSLRPAQRQFRDVRTHHRFFSLHQPGHLFKHEHDFLSLSLVFVEEMIDRLQERKDLTGE